MSDVEDLLYKEHVPSGTIYKVMQAVRQAVSWHKATAIRPWATELEDGLTRQEDRRAEERRARLAESLREEGRARAAAGAEELARVNSSREVLSEALADAWATAAAAGAPGSPSGATLRLVQGGAGTITPEAVPEAPEAVLAPQTEAPPVTEVGTWLNVIASDPEKANRTGNVDPFVSVLPPAPSTPAPDAPASPAAPPSDVAAPLPGAAVPPAPPEPPAASSEAQERKRCTKCGLSRSLDDFQRDKRASDGRRPSCKICSSKYDEMRRNLKKSLRENVDTAVDVAVDEAEAADERESASAVQQVQEMIAGISKPQPKLDFEAAVQETPSRVSPQLMEPMSEEQAQEFRASFAEAVKNGKITVMPPERKTLGSSDFDAAVQEYFKPEPGTEVLIPRFSPPVEEEQDEDPGTARTCTACGTLKAAGEYYTRRDGRLRFKCKECEKRESRERKLARSAGGA